MKTNNSLPKIVIPSGIISDEVIDNLFPVRLDSEAQEELQSVLEFEFDSKEGGIILNEI